MPRFSKKAKRHAAMSARDKQRQINQSRRPSKVKVSYLPGFGPPDPAKPKTKYPFRATINGRPCTVTKEAIIYDERT